MAGSSQDLPSALSSSSACLKRPRLYLISMWSPSGSSPLSPQSDQLHGTQSLQTILGRCLNSTISLCSHRPLRTENMVYFWSPYLYLVHLGLPSDLVTTHQVSSISGYVSSLLTLDTLLQKWPYPTLCQCASTYQRMKFRYISGEQGCFSHFAVCVNEDSKSDNMRPWYI